MPSDSERVSAMAMYQIRFIQKGHGHFEYFNATADDAPTIACQLANEYLATERSRVSQSIWSAPLAPIRTLTVVEYDNVKRATKRRGHRFKIRLRYIELFFRGGQKVRNDWYEPVEDFQ